MIDPTRYRDIGDEDIQKGADVLITPQSDVGTTIKGRYLSETDEAFVIAPEGANIGVPFPKADWRVFVPRLFPAPNQGDVAMLIANAVQQGVAGHPKTFDEIASEILSLIVGDIAPGVEPYLAPVEIPRDEAGDPALTVPPAEV